MAKELTQGQIDRQDFIDNLIQNLICEVGGIDYPQLDKLASWDIDAISDIRDALQEVICDKLKIMSPMDFYPFMEDGEGAPTPEPKGKVYIDVDGGNITCVYGPAGLECLIIDADNGDADDDVRAENERKTAEEEAAIEAGEIIELY